MAKAAKQLDRPTGPVKPGDTYARWAWIAENLQIQTKPGKIAPLIPNRGQQIIVAAMHMQESRGLPVRILLLKARQFGGSTGIQADFYARMVHEPHREAFTLAHTEKATERIFGMTKRFYDLTPKRNRLPIDAKNGYQLRFKEPHGGGLAMATAGSKDAARSGTYQLAHLSEYSFYPDQPGVIAAVDSAVPYAPGTVVVIETTANGMGDDFHERWIKAVNRYRAGDLTGYIPVFVSWLHIADYSMAVPSYYDWDTVDPEVGGEEDNLRAMGATREQLYWRRRKIAGFNGNTELFHQEFPATWEEAFVASGSPAIRASIVAHHRLTARPGRKCRLHLDPMTEAGVRAEYDESLPEPFWRVWRPPFERGDYAIGGDVAEGGLSDPQNEQSDRDKSYALVIERATLEDAAEWHGWLEADLFGMEMLKAAMWFNWGWASPEANSAGQSALHVFKRAHYPRIMQRQAAVDKINGQPLMADGWKTTTANREQAIDDLIAHLRPAPGGDYEGKMLVHSAVFCDECGTFVRVGARGKREHMRGKHDDTIFGRLVALQIHLACPRMFLPKATPPRRQAQTFAALNRPGAVDYGPNYVGGIVGGIGYPEEST